MFPAAAALQNVVERARARLPAARVEAATWQGGGGGQAAGWERIRSPARARVPTHGRGPTGHRGQRPSPDTGPGPGPEQGVKTRLRAQADPGALPAPWLTPMVLPAPRLHGTRDPSCPAASAQGWHQGRCTWSSSPERRHAGPRGWVAGLEGGPASVPDGGRGQKAREPRPGRTQRPGPRPEARLGKLAHRGPQREGQASAISWTPPEP